MREPDPTEHADELADVFENHDPTPGEFGAPLPPLMAVKLAAFRRAAAEKELAEAIPLGTARLVAALGGFGVALLPIALTTTAFDPVGPGWLFGGVNRHGFSAASL